MKEKIYTVTEEYNLTRLDQYLSSFDEITSRSRAQQLIKKKLVSINESPLKSSYKVQTGDKIKVSYPQEKVPSKLLPYDFALDIVFEDNDLIVINKPSGLVVHPAPGHYQDTLVNALLHYTKDLSMGFNEERPGIVHRLDKDTSGLILVAKNDYSQLALSKQFLDKSIQRNYLALVYATPKELKSTIVSHLMRHPIDRKKYCSEKVKEGQEPRGKLAITHYEVIHDTQRGLSLIQCKLETGRTHQIRIHLSELGHSILGDNVYGNKNRSKNLKSLKLRGLINKMQRLALHANEISFIHPRSKDTLSFKVPWPDDLSDFKTELELGQYVD